MKKNQSTKEQLQDFVVADMPAVYAEFRDNRNWDAAIAQIRKQVFNSSSTAIASPGKSFLERIQHKQPGVEHWELLDYIQRSSQNSDPLCSLDPLDYRRCRSEDVLFRVVHHRRLDLNQISLTRLSQGVFVHQIISPCKRLAEPTLLDIQSYLLDDHFNMQVPIDTFGFDSMQHMINDGSASNASFEAFVPYSYTFGARYTNPFLYGGDLMVRGKLPLWCQLLFLSTCMEQKERLRPNTPYTGLFSFAPHVPVTFKRLIDEEDVGMPELTIVYEHLTMEHIDSFSLPEDPSETPSLMLWSERQKEEVFKSMLICNLPDDVAEMLGELATQWAAEQGLLL